MAKTFHLTIARVGENIFDGEALSAQFPGADGNFTVLANHEALVTPLKEGEAKVEGADGKDYRFPIPQGGIAEVSGNQATIIL